MSAIASDVHASTTAESSQPPNTSSALTVLGVSALVIAYLCLFPFVLTGSLAAASIGGISFADFTPGDIVANVVLFLPWGAAVGWAARGRFSVLLAVILAAAGAAVLSIGFEATDDLQHDLQQALSVAFSTHGH